MTFITKISLVPSHQYTGRARVIITRAPAGPRRGGGGDITTRVITVRAAADSSLPGSRPRSAIYKSYSLKKTVAQKNTASKA